MRRVVLVVGCLRRRLPYLVDMDRGVLIRVLRRKHLHLHLRRALRARRRRVHLNMADMMQEVMVLLLVLVLRRLLHLHRRRRRLHIIHICKPLLRLHHLMLLPVRRITIILRCHTPDTRHLHLHRITCNIINHNITDRHLLRVAHMHLMRNRRGVHHHLR